MCTCVTIESQRIVRISVKSPPLPSLSLSPFCDRCEKRTNDWLSRLKLIHVHPNDPKAVVFRVVEYSRGADAPADAPWVVLTKSQCFARLIAKNSGQLRTGKKKRLPANAVAHALQAPIQVQAAVPSAVATGAPVPARFAPRYAYAYNGDPAMLPQTI